MLPLQEQKAAFFFLREESSRRQETIRAIRGHPWHPRSPMNVEPGDFRRIFG
jgi:hypothetical protein